MNKMNFYHIQRALIGIIALTFFCFVSSVSAKESRQINNPIINLPCGARIEILNIGKTNFAGKLAHMQGVYVSAKIRLVENSNPDALLQKL